MFEKVSINSPRCENIHVYLRYRENMKNLYSTLYTDTNTPEINVYNYFIIYIGNYEVKYIYYDYFIGDKIWDVK